MTKRKKLELRYARYCVPQEIARIFFKEKILWKTFEQFLIEYMASGKKLPSVSKEYSNLKNYVPVLSRSAAVSTPLATTTEFHQGVHLFVMFKDGEICCDFEKLKKWKLKKIKAGEKVFFKTSKPKKGKKK